MLICYLWSIVNAHLEQYKLTIYIIICCRNRAKIIEIKSNVAPFEEHGFMLVNNNNKVYSDLTWHHI